jgi:hypothetical protein
MRALRPEPLAAGARLPGAFRSGIEQDPDLALEPIQPDPRIAFREEAKLALAEAQGVLQSGTVDFTSNTEFTAQAHL